MPKTFQHARALIATSARESAWSEILGRNATAIRQLQLLRHLIPTFLRTSSHGHPWHQFRTLTIIASASQYSSSVTSTITTTIFAVTVPVSVTTITTNVISDGGSVLNCPHCDCTFTSRIGLLNQLRIHRTVTGEPVPGAPNHTRDCRSHYAHCPGAFTHRMGLLG
ncbi:unnamed protein product [Schistocephalus solidus]|uniref:C2H2-type domain-containing protein n=1 Tax=Schistocephalus solidus TaxID=70667 RepID=A0A183SLY0_SCHSO|nr:unnamed protein product [Schistocephalus solidus]